MTRWLLLTAYVLAVVLAAHNWSTDQLSHYNNRVANELPQNGVSSFVRAASRTRSTTTPTTRGTQGESSLSWLHWARQRLFTRLSEGRVDRTFPGARARALNVVVIASESFGAEFSKLYGSKRDRTPNFD